VIHTPCAATVCERVGKSLEMHATRNPFAAKPNAARKPAPFEEKKKNHNTKQHSISNRVPRNKNKNSKSSGIHQHKNNFKKNRKNINSIDCSEKQKDPL
jgi:hypothetical protein